MFSIIIPTLWKINFEEEILKLQKSDLVEEIILINNNKNNTPDWYNSINKQKIKTVIPESNMFVNPSWNFGVRIAVNPFILISSDDVKAKNYNFLQIIYNELINDDCLIGIENSCYTYCGEDSVELVDISNINRDIGFGCMMFLRKLSYKNIPEEYLIWRGDDFLIDLFKHRGKKIKTIKNLNLSNSLMSVSSDSPEFLWKEEKEGLREKYCKYLEEYLK